jgi:hypothetical protein
VKGLSPAQHKIWGDLNRPPYSEFRESEKLVKPEKGTLTWLLKREAAVRSSTELDSDTIELVPGEQAQDELPLLGFDFLNWRDNLQPSCLLVTAPPGSGKSVLSNFVIDHLHTYITHDAKVIYYFCNIRGEASERSAEAVVRALIVQLCQDKPRMMDLLPNRFEQSSDDFRKASLSELWIIMRDMVEKSVTPRVYCVIDGLDVYEAGMVNLVQKLVSLFSIKTSGGQPQRKLLCTSRPNREIKDAWAGRPERQLRAHAQDLGTFVESRIGELKDFRPEMRAAARAVLAKDIGDGSQHRGARPTFLWASIVVRKLQDLRVPTIAKVEKAINDSHGDLDELFEDLIRRTHARAREYVVVLAWVVYAQRPLRLPDLEHAVAINPACEYKSYKQLNEHWPELTPTSLRQDLGLLLDIIQGEVFVIHQSLQDFVKKTNFLEKLISMPPRLYIADSCLRYLLLCYSKDQKSEEVSRQASLSLLSIWLFCIILIHAIGAQK